MLKSKIQFNKAGTGAIAPQASAAKEDPTKKGAAMGDAAGALMGAIKDKKNKKGAAGITNAITAMAGPK